ncbi:MAG: formylglycine-generating enzyme family protein [Planctomycetota bacterium]
MFIYLRMFFIAVILFGSISVQATESPRMFPLWNGDETVATYAERVRLPPTKTLDLGGGEPMELVLIPAGEFIMGSAEPEKPGASVEHSKALFFLGTVSAAFIVMLIGLKYFHDRKLRFSLLTFMLFISSVGCAVGGFGRWNLALREDARYKKKLADFADIPRSEKPAHIVTLSQPFYIGKYTVTQEQYTAVIGTNPSHFKGTRMPVEMVSWNDAMAFCSTLKSKAMDVRLPTEAQWEFACRAGTRTRFYVGDASSDHDAAGWSNTNSQSTTHPVGQLKPNAFGVYDMHGNVFQMCQDFWEDRYPSSAPIRDPQGPRESKGHTLRGGAWSQYPYYCRSAVRFFSFPTKRDETVGFRVVMGVE